MEPTKIIVRHVIEMLLNPFFIGMVLFLVFLILLCLQNGINPWIRNGLVLVFMLLMLISTPWLPRTLTQYLEGQYPIMTKADPAIRWIVVFSGGQFEVPNRPPNSLLNSVSLDRLVEGVRLYRQISQAKLLLSGGGTSAKVSEAAHLSQVVAWFDIPKSHIVLETQSVNTAAEARAIKPLLQEMPFYLVTSAIHMPRAMALCQAQGLHPIAAPTDFTAYWGSGDWERSFLPSPYNLHALSIAMHEVLGSLAAKMGGLGS